MKYVLLTAFFAFLFFIAIAQNVTELPPGRYETKIHKAQKRWEEGDLILLTDNQYKLSSSGETGEYRFSVAAQRIFFTSGPLKSAFTKVTLVNKKPVIILPAEQNSSLGISSEVWASRQ